MAAILFFTFIFIALLLIPAYLRLALAACGSIFQFYTFSVGNFYPSLSLLATSSLIPNLVSDWRTFLQPPCLLFAAILLLQALSLLWSSDLHLGIATILYEAPFIILYVTAFNLVRKNPEKIIKIVKVYALLSLVPVMLIIFITLNHNVNQAFLTSTIAKRIINPNMIKLFLSEPGHTGWQGKPNGFFTNQNVGGGYFGICSFLFFGVGVYARSWLLKSIAILHWVTLFLTFSFAASGLAILLPLTLGSLHLWREKKKIFFLNTKLLITSFFSSIAIMVGLIFTLNPNFLHYTYLKFKSRFIFWKVASYLFPQHVIAGLGFGGWNQDYQLYREITPNLDPMLQANMPPHDTFIALWSQSGIFAAILGLLFMLSVIWFGFRNYDRTREKSIKALCLCVSGTWLWIFLQGMGENWGLVGEMHIQPIIALAFALMMGLTYPSRLSR